MLASKCARSYATPRASERSTESEVTRSVGCRKLRRLCTRTEMSNVPALNQGARRSAGSRHCENNQSTIVTTVAHGKNSGAERGSTYGSLRLRTIWHQSNEPFHHPGCGSNSLVTLAEQCATSRFAWTGHKGLPGCLVWCNLCLPCYRPREVSESVGQYRPN